MPDATHSALDRAISVVPAEQFHGADGRAVRPCTPAGVTHRHLRMLDVHPGANVLDIGIGSGLSAALLAQLAGQRGHVTAVEIDPGLAERAEALYAEHGHQVGIVVGDGLSGHPPGAPYDRILVGTTPPAVPDAWLQQLKPYGVLLCGVHISDLPGAYGIGRITVDEQHRPQQVVVHHGGYTPMVASALPGNVTRAADGEHPEHVLTLLGAQDPITAHSFLAALARARHTEPSPAQGSDYFHLKNWLIATEPDGLLEATLDQGTGIGTGMGIGIGSLSQGGAGHAALVNDDHLIADRAGSPALEALTALVHNWREIGSPRTHQLPAGLRREGDSWRVRISAGASTGSA